MRDPDDPEQFLPEDHRGEECDEECEPGQVDELYELEDFGDFGVDD